MPHNPFWHGFTCNLSEACFQQVTSALLTCYKFASDLLPPQSQYNASIQSIFRGQYNKSEYKIHVLTDQIMYFI